MKNLEDEYKRFYQEETPDLWNRIEAGLTDKKAGHKKITFPFRYLPVCAAAILLLVLLPGIWMFGGRKASETAPKEDMAFENRVPEAAGGIAVGEAQADTNGFVKEEECGEKDGVADSAEQYEVDAMQPEESTDNMMQDVGGTPSLDNVSPEAASTAGPSGEENTDGQISGGEAENLGRQIAEVMEVTAVEQKDGYIVYYLRTKEGAAVSAVFEEELPSAVQTGESYLFTLKTSEGTAWDYVIETVETAPAE